jgi:hypothetical protein
MGAKRAGPRAPAFLREGWGDLAKGLGPPITTIRRIAGRGGGCEPSNYRSDRNSLGRHCRHLPDLGAEGDQVAISYSAHVAASAFRTVTKDL